ncbi:hypothetical protein JTB14_037273 [Gonioctena quinquepunctata]|nr:hypothetical protein JTB14_037273 [Gonioctena quinquepunctata]
MDNKTKHVVLPNKDIREEIEKFGNLMFDTIISRTDKTDQEKHELIDIKSKEINEIIRYIANIIMGERELFDNHYEKIYANYIAEYIVISGIWADREPDQWKRYNQNRKIFEENLRKKPEEINETSEEGSKKGGEAGSVPRTYSMGAQPPPLDLPLDKESINVEGNKVRSPEICQIDGPMDATNETIESPNSTEDESSGKPTKNNENSKKKTLKRKKALTQMIQQLFMALTSVAPAGFGRARLGSPTPPGVPAGMHVGAGMSS